jgi:hypothetical protein
MDLFKAKVTTVQAMPNLADAAPVAAPAPAPAATLIRYTPEYFNWLESIYASNHTLFYQEYQKAADTGNEKHLPAFQNIIEANGNE